MMSELKNQKNDSKGWTARSNKTLTDKETHAALLSFYLSALYLPFKCYCRGLGFLQRSLSEGLKRFFSFKKQKKKKRCLSLYSWTLSIQCIEFLWEIVTGLFIGRSHDPSRAILYIYDFGHQARVIPVMAPGTLCARKLFPSLSQI